MRSDIIKKGFERAPHRSLLRATGSIESEADWDKPFIAICNSYTDCIPGHAHLNEVGLLIKRLVREAGGVPFIFNTIGVDDGIAMGHSGMKYSLPSRELIADSIELVARGNLFDGLVALAGCDKTLPGTVMALCRLDIPSLMIYGGSIAPGTFQGKNVSIQDVFEAVGAHARGRMSDKDLACLEESACPGAGACGGRSASALTFTMRRTASTFSPMTPALLCVMRTSGCSDRSCSCG